MKCSYCRTENPPDGRYCSKCGAHLEGEKAPAAGTAGALDEASELRVEKTVKEIERRAHLVENETYEKIQKKAVDWAKFQVIPLSAAVTVLLATLSIFGYTQFSDFRQKIDTGKAAVEKSTKEADATLKESRELTNQLATLRKEVSDIDVRHVHDEINKLKKSFEGSIAEARKISDQAQANRGEIEKLKNSFFDIFIQVQASQEQRRTVVPGIVKKLLDKGFVVGSSNIAQVEVDKAEVIYYNSDAAEKAKLLADVLTSDFQGIAPRLIDRRERSPREILIKLKLE